MSRKTNSKLAESTFRRLSHAGLKTASFMGRVVARARQENGSGWFPPLLKAIREEGEEAIGMGLPLMAEKALVKVGLASRVKEATRKQYSPRLPWIQPSPIHFNGLAPAVLNVPEEEVQDFLNTVVARYIKSLRSLWVPASLYAWRNPGLEAVDDREFCRLLQCTPFSRFLNPQLDPVDRSTFATLFEGTAGTESYFKVDLSPLAQMKPLPGMHVASTLSLFEKRPGDFFLTPKAIFINGVLLRPIDGAAWDLAKYFVLQGCALGLVVGVHPNVHFPMDAINALTKSILPTSHVVRQLLEPHFYMQLPLNYAVLYINRSVAHNNQSEIYTPFPCPKEDFFEFTRNFYAGIAGNSSYPAYRFPLEPTPIHSEYGEFLARYHQVILTFAKKVTWGVRRDDNAIRRWAAELSGAIAGFPSEKEIFHEDTLARVLATFIWDVSVVHSADHYAYAAESINKVPLRLRRAAPTSRFEAPLDLKALVSWEDLFRHYMAREMYFKPTTLQRLVDVQYPFTEPNLQRMVPDFLQALRTLDSSLTIQKFIPLSEIASSIQY